MKKILIALLFISIPLSGCAMAEEEPLYQYPDESIVYNKGTFSYDISNEIDILYNVDDVTEDFMYFIYINNYTMSEAQQTAYEDTFATLDLLEANTSFDYNILADYSSSDIQTFATEADIELSPVVIFTVNDLINITDRILEQNGSLVYSVSKIDYLEYRLDRSLSDIEVEGINQLQEYYYNMVLDGYDYPIPFYEVDPGEFITEMEQFFNRTFTEDEVSSLTSAILVIKELYQ